MSITINDRIEYINDPTGIYDVRDESYRDTVDALWQKLKHLQTCDCLMTLTSDVLNGHVR